MRLLQSLGLLLCLALPGCTTAPPPPAAPAAVVLGGMAYHSMPWQVKVATLPAGMSELQLHDALQARLDALEEILSTYRPDSELMRFNQAPVGSWVTVSPTLLRSVETALEVSVLTQGAYDVTVGPLVELWGFGAAPAPEGLPDAAALAAARARMGWQHIEVDGDQSRLRRRADVRLDLSSLGEGAGVDAMVTELELAGVHDYLVAIAGTFRLRGHRADGAPWQMAIEKSDGSGLPQRRLSLEGAAVSTSGAYRNYRDIGGRRYSHTLDPATGYPVTHRGVSVTVVLPEGSPATRVDALATAFNVLGPERGLALAQAQGLAVFYIEATDDGLRERWSPAFAAYLAD